jgi:hypothetical protein
LGFVVGYVIGVSEERQCDLPIAVGNADSQQRFISEHAEFLREHHKIHLLLTKIFIRPLARPSEEGIEGLPDDDPAVIAFENKIIANRLIFYLGRTAADDFGELLVLAGNGYGVGALKILRGMYERMVTAAFFATKPSEARIFAEDDTIKKWKLWREHVEIIPELEDRPTKEQKREFEERYNAIRAKRKQEECPKCRQPKTQEAWTRVTIKDMAKQADSVADILILARFPRPRRCTTCSRRCRWILAGEVSPLFGRHLDRVRVIVPSRFPYRFQLCGFNAIACAK